MNKIIIKYYLFIFTVTPILCQYQDLDLLLDEGISNLYNYQFKNSKTLLDSVLKIDSLHPLPPFLLIVVDWLHNQTEFGYDQSYSAIINGVNSTIPIYESLIEKNPKNAEYYLYLGSTYGLKARVSLASKEWFEVLYSGYKGVKYIRKANELDASNYDYYLPIGLLEYYLCISSIPVQMGGRLLGFNPDCEVGKINLELALDKAKYSWIEAANILTYIYLYFERDYSNALRTISPLVDLFPGHPFFTFLKAETLAKMGNWEEVNIMRPRLKYFSQNGPFLQRNECELKLRYIDALKAFTQKDYNKVLKETNWIINNYHMEFDWLLGFAYMIRAKTFNKLNMSDLALKNYNSIIKLNNYFPEIKEAENLINSSSIKQ